MLFLLTGEVQIGKTRWLSQLCQTATNRGFIVSGVLAPGVWSTTEVPGVEATESADGVTRWKTGIDNVLLPQKERIGFALHRSVAQQQEAYDPTNASAKAGMLWHIDDTAVDRVNRHFAALSQRWQAHPPEAGMVVVDELGQLELCRNQGLTDAMALLRRGPIGGTRTALVVVRKRLLADAHDALEGPWIATREIAPSDEAMSLVLEDLSRSLR